jgi:hypothetical protein
MSVLRFPYTEACARLDRRLAGLIEDEFLWEPVRGAWTLHGRADDRGVTADGSGEWVLDYVLPEPDPVPVTTIALAGGTYRVGERPVLGLRIRAGFGHFRPGVPRQCSGRAQLALGQPAPDRRRHRLGDRSRRGTPDELGEIWPTWHIVSTLVDEQIHHGAEISLLRDLYPHRR